MSNTKVATQRNSSLAKILKYFLCSKESSLASHNLPDGWTLKESVPKLQKNIAHKHTESGLRRRKSGALNEEFEVFVCLDEHLEKTKGHHKPSCIMAIL